MPRSFMCPCCEEYLTREDSVTMHSCKDCHRTVCGRCFQKSARCEQCQEESDLSREDYTRKRQ